MSAVKRAIENEILDGGGLNCIHDYQTRWACVPCTRDVLTRIARLAASEAANMGIEEGAQWAEEYENGYACGRPSVDAIVFQVLGEEVGT